MKVEHSVVIDAPLAEVWDAFDDPDAMVEWQDNLLEYEQLEGSSDEEGSVSLQTIKQMGMKQELTATLLERRPPEFSKSHYVGAQVPFTAANTFTELENGTTEWTAVLEIHLNLMQKALGPVLKPLMIDLVNRNGKSFKAYVEG